LADYILEAKNVSYTYPDGTQALKEISLKIPKGKKTAFLGSNGAGKSTLFLHFNGILKPQAGVVRFGGRDVSYNRKNLLELRKNVGIVFQDPDSQLFSASVYQEISFGPLNYGLSEKEVRERVERALVATGITELSDKPTHMLSYGQKKRVTIADILAVEPEVLICDEPTAWLDPKHARQTIKLFNRINRDGTTVILSTHDVDLAYSWADYVFVLDDGRVIGEGEPEKVLRDEILIRKASLDKPWLVELYEVLVKKGCLSSKTPVPRSKEEMLELIPEHGICIKRGEESNDYDTGGNEGRERTGLTVNLQRL